MRYGYFDSEIIGTDSEGMPIFDRAETSDLFRLLFSKLVSNGVLASPSDCFQVVAAEGLNVTVRPGFGMIKGAFAYDDAENRLALAAAPTQYSRIDRIVLRCNFADRLCELVVKTGTVANTPAAPEIVQPAAGDYFELGLATVLVSANATAVTQANITDTRLDSAVCGFITQLIDHLDTSTFFDQLDQFYTEFVSKTEADYQLSREQYLEMCQDIVDTLTTFEQTAEGRRKIFLKANARNEAVMDEYLEKYGAKAETVRMTHGRALDFMGFEFHRDRTVLRKSIMISATRKAARIGAAHRINWVEAAGMLSYMGWIDHTNTYAMYLEWVKPYVNIKRLKKIISNHQRRLNNGIDLQNRQGLPADAPGGARSHVEPGQGVSAS